mgnify:CR=1 FL=1
MKRLIKHIMPWALLCMLGTAGCAKYNTEVDPSDENTGTLRLSVTLPSRTAQLKSASQYDALALSTLRVYKIENDTEVNLIRKYKPATEVPSDLYLVAGKYKVTVEAGDNSEASFTHKTYRGEETFDLAAHEVKLLPVNCKIRNIVVKVVFDATIAAKFDQGYLAYVSAADAFSKTDAENGFVPSLKYTTDSTGYYLLPEGTSNLSWGFYGSSSDPDVNKNGTKTGVISLPQNGMQYTLTYKYSKTADGQLTVGVQVREYESTYDDNFTFSPQPTLSGDGFNLNSVTGYYADAVKFKVSSINPLASISFTAGGVQYNVMAGGEAIDGIAADGITYVKTDEFNGSLALDGTFFAKLTSGINTLDFVISDTDNSEGKASARIAVAGASGIEAADLWFGTARLNAAVTNPAATDVKIRYRINGTEAWTELAANKGSDGYTYTADATGFRADHTYDLQLMENGVESGAVKSIATATGIQLPNSGFEEWHKSGKAMYPYASGATPFWGTGNPGATSLGESFNLTDGVADPRPGSTGSLSAKLETKEPNFAGIGKLAAGNLFVGAFGGVSGMGGTVYMGRPYVFNARPTHLRVWYKYTPVGSDKGRIYICLTNMTNGDTHHIVDTNNPDKTTFSPDDEFLYVDKTNTATQQGHILGYGDLMLETAVTTWTQVDIPIIYRDQYLNERPNVLILTAAASYRGDYFEGEVGSTMFVDDIEFVY